MSLSVEQLHKKQLDIVRDAVRKKKNVDQLKASLTAILSEGDVLDQSMLFLVFRVVLEEEMLALPDVAKPSESVQHLLSLALWSSETHLLLEDAVIRLLEDLLSFQTILGCEKVFPMIEANLLEVIHPKRSLFVTRTKLGLLRICNCLLKRLSKTTNTHFCGQILMLVAKSLPIDERSGINVTGVFNESNRTDLHAKPKPKPKPKADPKAEPNDGKAKRSSKLMEVEEEGGSQSNKTPSEAGEGGVDGVDYEFYRDLWGLQSYFMKPKMLDSEGSLSKLEGTLNKVFEVFEGNKLDQHEGAGAGFQGEQEGDSAKEGQQVHYPKYLTGARLLNLQLQDGVFRRNLLTQCDLFFSFLLTDVTLKRVLAIKPKLDSRGISRIKAWRRRVERLLSSTPPNGSQYAGRLKRTLQREAFWSKWKDKLCPAIEGKGVGVRGEGEVDLDKTLELNISNPIKPKQVRGKFIFRRNNSVRMKMGDPILYRLWTSLSKDNLDSTRLNYPTLKQWMQKAIDDDNDPLVSLEKNRRNNKLYVFRALRLMAREDMDAFMALKGKLDHPKPSKPSKVASTKDGKDAKAADGKSAEGKTADGKTNGRIADSGPKPAAGEKGKGKGKRTPLKTKRPKAKEPSARGPERPVKKRRT